MKTLRLAILLTALAAGLMAREVIVRSAQTGAQTQSGPFDRLHFRPLGPASMSGRISDLAVYDANPSIFYVGTAHGGVWKTTNAGTTFDAQLQDQGLLSIGDVTISQSNPDLVWVGTGESNNRQSTSWGDGVYKSTNGGKTYVNMGLKTSRFINRILIDPKDNDTVFVAATGSLWGPGGDRGVYKSTDAGKTWKRTLFVNEDTGANDLVMDPVNNQILYASMYQRRRTTCCMNGGGPESGIWKSTDGGETWTRLKNGIPDEPLGRIGLDISRRRPNILYALIEGQAPLPARGANAPAAEEAPQGGGRGQTVATGADATPTGLYRTDDGGTTWRKVNNENPRPMYFSQVRVDPNDPDVVFYAGVKLHRSLDGGKTVTLNVTQTIHDDVHAIWIDPANSQHVIIGNDGGVAVSWDQAQTWNFVHNLPVGLFYHVGVDNATPYNICGGMQDNYVWCGPSAVRGAVGVAGFNWATMQGGDGFVALQDPGDPRVAYSESQDGNMVRIDRVTGETMSIRPLPESGQPALRWNWDTPLVMSFHDPRVIYASANKVFRSANRGLNWESSGSDLTANANRDDIVTMGLKGSDIRIAKNDGIAAWPTVVSFAESGKRATVLYAGTDDGNVQVSRDTGRSWTNVTANIPGLPKGTWVSEIVPSRFDEATVYATFDGHRENDFNTYIYVSHDYGQTWQSAAANLKDEVVKTMTEDTRNADVLYLGAETGLFVSIDRAKSWTRIAANLPTVRIDEIALHARDNAMILATHGRAIWILDHLESIQEYAAAQAAAADAKLFTPPPFSMYRRPARDRNYEFWGDQTFYGENPPAAAVISWFNKKQVGDVKLRITNAAGREIREISGEVLASTNKPGIQSACWDLRVQPLPPAPPDSRGRGREGRGGEEQPSASAGTQSTSSAGAGCASPTPPGGGFGAATNTNGPLVIGGVYNVSLVVDGKTVDTKPLRVNDDPDVLLTAAERKRQFDMAMEVHALQPAINDASAAFGSLTRQTSELSTTLGGRSDVPAEVKTSFDAFSKELAALAPRLTAPQGRGGGRGGATDNLVSKAQQAKNVLMGGMSVGEQTVRAYTETKAQTPRTLADLNAVIARASTVAASLAPYNLTLNVPQPVKVPDAAVAKPAAR